MQLGMAWPEEIDQTVGSTWYLKWQSEAEMSFKSRKSDDLQWFLWFVVRLFIYGYILFHAFRFLKRKVPRLLGFGPLRSKGPNLQKLRRVVLPGLVLSGCNNFTSAFCAYCSSKMLHKPQASISHFFQCH